MDPLLDPELEFEKWQSKIIEGNFVVTSFISMVGLTGLYFLLAIALGKWLDPTNELLLFITLPIVLSIPVVSLKAGLTSREMTMKAFRRNQQKQLQASPSSPSGSPTSI